MFLDDRNFFRRHLDAQIAASHHHPIRRFEDLLQLLERLRLFQFGDDWDVASAGLNHLLHLLNVGSRAHEGKGDDIHSVFQAKLQVFAVFFGERGNGERNSGQIDSLVFAQQAAIDHLAFHVFPAHSCDAQLNQAVGKQNAGARRAPPAPCRQRWWKAGTPCPAHRAE